MEQLITKERVTAAAEALRALCPGLAPELGIVLGSGMGDMGERIENMVAVDYNDVPGMVPATVQSHKGRFLIGEVSGKRVICMQGRLHAYEGNSAQQIAFPVYVMRELGIQTLVLTNAAGGIRPEYQVGDLMIINDFINFQFMNPVVGPENGFGPRFYDMTNALSPELRKTAHAVADDLGISVHEGVYIGDLGPSFETPAEIRAFRMMGADAVGMSTVMEIIAANQLGLPTLGISLISNPAAGVSDVPLSMDDIYEAAAIAAENIWQLIEGVAKRL